RVAVGIDDRDELQLRPGHEPGVDLPLRLHPAADLREQDHVAGGNVAAAAQHAARDDGECGRRGEKLPTIDVHHAATSKVLNVVHQCVGDLTDLDVGILFS